MMPVETQFDHAEFADIDRHFAGFIATFGGDEWASTAALFLSRNIRLGHTCLDLAVAPEDFAAEWPALAAWRKALAKNRAVGEVDESRPLVIDGSGRLYLRRYWEYECLLAGGILDRCDAFPPGDPHRTDAQQLAIETALARRFVVISGGPGTGKTTTVFKILARLVQAHPGGSLRIALAAPTGKAAARLQETLRTTCHDETLRERLPKSASTLHRLLGHRHGSVYFQHNARNTLPVDVVVVDEASMVSLTLMAKLVDALPAHAKLILLGDCDQLASVEPGAVIGDIADAASRPGSPLHGSLVVLKKNYRFGNQSGIFTLCNAVREGDADRSLSILNGAANPDLAVEATPSPSALLEKLHPRVLEGYGAYLRISDPGLALMEFQKFRILSAHRTGPYGVVNLNRAVESVLRSEGLLDGASLHYRGLPVLVTRNDYQLGLYNGDIGILLPGSDGTLLAWFAAGDGKLRSVLPSRLPEHEAAYAMTVHKSQGSEFGSTLLILPDRESPVLTRELVYTGLTRARDKVDVWLREPVLRCAIQRRIKRSSGLRDRLAGGKVIGGMI